MFYSIRHITRFRYSEPVRESVMSLYMQPRTEGRQRLQSFQVQIRPHAQLFAYSDHLGNAVYHFDVPGAHDTLTITADSTVEMEEAPRLPEALPAQSWAALRDAAATQENWDMLKPSRLARSSIHMREFGASLGVDWQRLDPLSGLRALNAALFSQFGYDPELSPNHAPLDEALNRGRGTCQDFAHIMTVLTRAQGIPCRYVSGYVYRSPSSSDRSRAGIAHAWVEAWLPGVGWVGFDATNGVVVADRHVRVAIGRDYTDVPPSRGAFKGVAASELAVSVSVHPTEAPAHHEDFLRIVRPMPPGLQDEDVPFPDQQQ
jgi:transglutaminase-like putative cysteine protease